MRVQVLAVGKMKEKPYRAMADEYLKRLSRFGKYTETEVPDLPEAQGASPAEENALRQREGERLMRQIRPGQYVIALTLGGRQMTSEGFAAHLAELALRGNGDITFVIGGSLGLSEALIASADEELCMGRMTFPHQLARVMLLEQLYRAEKINAGERYHK